MASIRPAFRRAASQGGPASPLTRENDPDSVDAVLELYDGSAFRGISFGAEGKSVAGECVFQTGQSIL